MVIENVVWDNNDAFANNLLYGIGRPTWENIQLRPEGLSIVQSATFGRATYKYDFGREGTTSRFYFYGTPLLKFRIKTADTVSALDSVQYDGTDSDFFPGSIINPSKYTSSPGVYNLVQNNGIRITGMQTGSSGVFENPAELSLIDSLTNTYSVSATMQLTVSDDVAQNTGSLASLKIDNGLNKVEVQKYYAQIRPQMVDVSGSGTGRDVDSNDIVLGDDVEIDVNSIPQETTAILTDGRIGSIKDEVVNPIVVDEFFNLKDVEEVVDFFGRTSLKKDCVRILGIRADYSLTGILADMQQGLYYKPKRTHGYYTQRIPLVNPKADMFANDIVSLNLDSRLNKYTFAEVNDHWVTTVLVPAGVHYYYFSVDGQKQLDRLNPNTITIASGIYSSLTVESTRFIQFAFDGKASKVSVVGTFNNLNDKTNPMEVGFDPAEILKISTGGTYCNNHHDWHKVEVTFEQPVPIMMIRFLTGVPFEQQQRVRILLNDAPITRDEWEITCAPEQPEFPGVSLCATYSNLFGGGTSEPLSHFINNTDTITASEDGWVEWNFIANRRANFREPVHCKKLSFMTRLENYSLFQRMHRGLEVIAAENFVAKVTDFLVSDNEVPFRSVRQTQACAMGIWSIPQVVLHPGLNTILPSEIFEDPTYGEITTYGEPISITHSSQKSFIEPLNESGVALNNTEIACTLAAQLTENLVDVLEVTDIGVSAPGFGPPPEPRFTRESFTRASDRLRVVVINIDIIPVRTFYLHLVGQATNFKLELYETLSDAQARINRVGYADSSVYGFQVIPVFVVERPIITPAGPEDVDVENIIVCFDEHAANTVFMTTPRANV